MINIIDLIAFSFSLLSFLLVFGFLQRVNMFTKRINIIVALIISLFVLFIFYEYKGEVIIIFSAFGIFVVVLLSFLVLYKSFNRKTFK